jgi:hypothetical protein
MFLKARNVINTASRTVLIKHPSPTKSNIKVKVDETYRELHSARDDS